MNKGRRLFFVWIWRVWCFLYFITLFYVVFFAQRRPSPHYGGQSLSVNWSPLVSKWEQYRHGWNISALYVDVMGNVVMFVPFVLFLYIVFGVRSYGWMILNACLLSIGIETTQYIFAIGRPDVDDVILNTLGAILGSVVIAGILQGREVAAPKVS